MIIPDGQALPEGVRYFTNSELQTFKQCRRRWWLQNYRKLQPKKRKIGGPAPLGTRVHNALEGWYVPEGASPVDPLDTVEREAQADRQFAEENHYMPDEIKQLEDDIKFARIMVEGYLEWLEETGADVGLKVIAPEARVAVPLGAGHDVQLLAKMDVKLVRESDGARLILDHKTSGLSFAQKMKNLHIDEQMLHYHLVDYLNLDDKDQRTDGAIYNMIRTVKRTSRAKPPFYQRVEVRHNLDQLRSYYHRTVATIEAILHVEEMLNDGCDPRKIVYPTPTESCSWKCDFFNVCSMFDDGSRIEDFLQAKYVEISPLERYK
jgi:hypothetical protein